MWIVRLDQSVGGRAVGEAVGRSVGRGIGPSFVPFVGSVPLSFRWSSVGRLAGRSVDLKFVFSFVRITVTVTNQSFFQGDSLSSANLDIHIYVRAQFRF